LVVATERVLVLAWLDLAVLVVAATCFLAFGEVFARAFLVEAWIVSALWRFASLVVGSA